MFNILSRRKAPAGQDNDSQDKHEEKKPKSRKPPNTAFRQQRLLAYSPILTPKAVLPIFFAVGLIFGPIGGLLLYSSSKAYNPAPKLTDMRLTLAGPRIHNRLYALRTACKHQQFQHNPLKPRLNSILILQLYRRDTTSMASREHQQHATRDPTIDLLCSIHRPDRLCAPGHVVLSSDEFLPESPTVCWECR
jgi:hypothetical protein